MDLILLNKFGVLTFFCSIPNIFHIVSSIYNLFKIYMENTDLHPDAQPHCQDEFIGKTFMFYSEDSMGLVIRVLFTFENIKQLNPNKTILVGTVSLSGSPISGNGIIVDFTKDKVLYHETKTRHNYQLETDKRTKDLWDNLLCQLKSSLETSR